MSIADRPRAVVTSAAEAPPSAPVATAVLAADAGMDIEGSEARTAGFASPSVVRQTRGSFDEDALASTVPTFTGNPLASGGTSAPEERGAAVETSLLDRGGRRSHP